MRSGQLALHSKPSENLGSKDWTLGQEATHNRVPSVNFDGQSVDSNRHSVLSSEVYL